MELHPLGERWRAYVSHPAVLELAGELGHLLNPDGMEREMARYQLPPGLLPWLRYRTGYWEWRGRAARWLRELGVVPSATDEARGLPPRSLRETLRDVLPRRGRA